jgi:hypothetical protein
MIKLFLTGLWVCGVTLGAVYFSVQMAKPPVPGAEEAAKKAGFELVKGESITVPVIADGAVSGYFLGRISFMMDKEKIKGVKLPVTELMTDELFTLLVGNKMVDIGNVSAFDVNAFRARIKEDMNSRMGAGMVEEVLVEQLDYLSKGDMRANNGAQKKPSMTPVKIVAGEAAAAAKPTH